MAEQNIPRAELTENDRRRHQLELRRAVDHLNAANLIMPDFHIEDAAWKIRGVIEDRASSFSY